MHACACVLVLRLQGALTDGKPALPQGLVANERTVANFTAEPAISTFEFAGMDYAAIRQQVRATTCADAGQHVWLECCKRGSI